MSIKLLAGTATLTTLLAASTGAAGAAGSGAAGARAAKTATIHVIERAVTDTQVPSGGAGPADATGNALTFHNQVYDAKDRRRVGHDQGFCMRISPAEGSWECLWTTFLSHGQITVEGPFYDKKNSVLAITGGTGAYRSARGDMQLKSRKRGTEYDFIFHLAG
jgi:allene oxide cyclase